MSPDAKNISPAVKTAMFVKDLMTKNVVSIYPEDPVIKAAQILFDKNFDGLPVITHDNILIGIITQYDLVTKGANIHLPTFVQLMKEFNVYKEDKESVRPALEKIVTLAVRDVMNPEPFTVVPQHTVEEVGKFFSEHHRVNPIPVIDDNRRVVGIISRYDIIKLYTGTDKTAEAISRESSVEKKVDLFVDQFESNFILVHKWRPVFWHLAIPLLVLLGALIVLGVIFKIEIQAPPGP